MPDDPGTKPTAPASGATKQTPPEGAKGERFSFTTLVRTAWWLLGALAILAFLRGPGLRTAAGAAEIGWFNAATLLDALRTIAVGGLIFVAFFIGDRILRALRFTYAAQTTTEKAKDDEAASGTQAAEGDQAKAPPKTVRIAFPASPTVTIAIWLAVISLVLTLALIESLAPMLFITERFPALSCGVEGDACGDLRNLLVTMFAAGIGAMITTILGYLDHASTAKDFDEAFVPWYVARPLIGMLLGIVFYFVIKGGLLATVGSQNASEIDVYGLGAFAALVGLFSKQAVEKLRDVFGTLFITQSDVDKQVKKVTDRVITAAGGNPDETKTRETET